MDGVKLIFGSRGWLLHRLSGTEPIIRIYAEHEDAALIGKLLDETEAELVKLAIETRSRYRSRSTGGRMRKPTRPRSHPRSRDPRRRRRVRLLRDVGVPGADAHRHTRAGGRRVLQRRHLLPGQGGQVRGRSRRPRTTRAKKAKLLEKSKSQHESSIKKYQKAVAKNPQMFQAWGSLGYAYRKTGNYPAALEAYDKALALEKSYTPAIEYRAEAYLGLNRLDDVKSAYMLLFNADRKRADELASAMQKYVETRQADPAGVDPAALAGVREVGRRAQAARLPDLVAHGSRTLPRAGSATVSPRLPSSRRLLLLAAAGFSWRLPPGFPPPRVPADNPVTAEKVALGRRLFYDVRLSGNGTQACASCHQQRRAFTDGRARALGSTGESHPRSAMSLANVAYAASLTWVDAGQRSLEDQMLVPLLGVTPREMDLGGHEEEIAGRLGSDPLYSKLFSEAFPGERAPVNLGNVQKAIASFERTLLSGNAPYDRLVWKDERDALSPAARRGMALFFSERLSCSKCHAGFTFSGPVAWEGRAARRRPRFEDNGLGGRFRVPTLRNVAVTAPYMHDGRFATLGEP